MPPKRVLVEPAGGRSRAPKGFFASTYAALTSPENASVVRSVAVFGGAVAFIASPLAEYLLTPAEHQITQLEKKLYDTTQQPVS
ncbi:hypothetical protein F5Y15DRAFT_418781 [Xylariaceae sp. FL0016]|nr:hypothetical protein F5Y15DRAFT_418781 [Xylariaceae sp. FL0016]